VTPVGTAAAISGNSARPDAHYPTVIRGSVTTAAAGLGLVAALAGCGSAATGAATGPTRTFTLASSSATDASGSTTVHGMAVTGAFIPLPASPSVAAAYLDLHNLTGRADTLMSVTTTVAHKTMAMSEQADAMAGLGPVKIPAHGRVSFTPGHDHVMLQGLTRKLAVGQHVVVTLHFADAGTVRVTVPVVPLDRILGTAGSGGSTGGSGSSMAGMAGM
jgi:copper(I)-binding protein